MSSLVSFEKPIVHDACWETPFHLHCSSRLDLRPGHTSFDEFSEPNDSLAPPLALEGEDTDSTHAPHGNRLTRLFDVNRLRQAPVEERIEALRQMRAHAQSQETDAQETTATDRPQAAKLTDKLKDKFRIRTRAQVAAR